jgi:hypothetical protein
MSTLNLTFSNTVLTSKSNDVFTQVFTFSDLTQTGMKFKQPHKAKEGDGHYIIAKVGDNEMVIPCGKSVSDTTDVRNCKFGVTADNTLLAFINNSSDWVE